MTHRTTVLWELGNQWLLGFGEGYLDVDSKILQGNIIKITWNLLFVGTEAL